jgi:hypothetical protein
VRLISVSPARGNTVNTVLLSATGYIKKRQKYASIEQQY